MRKVLMLAVLITAVPMATWASSSIDFQNFHGKAYYGGGVISTRSIGSNYSSIQGLGGKGAAGITLGKVVFTTGKLSSGSLLKGGTFAAGGSFTIQGLGKHGISGGSISGGTISGGTMFAGKFSGPVSVTTIKVNGIYQFTLKGTVSGMWLNGKRVSGLVTLNLAGTKNCPSCMHFNGGSVDIALPVPEPGTLSLLGLGLVGLAGVVRRRVHA